MQLRRVIWTLLFLALATTLLPAQTNIVNFRVMVSFQDHTPLSKPINTGMAGVADQNRSAGGTTHATGLAANLQIRVQVLDDSGSVAAEKSPDSEGNADFRVVGSIQTSTGTIRYATYRVRVFGSEIEEAWAENVQPAVTDRMLNITIRRKGEKNIKTDKSTVSAASLKIPSKAQKELDKGNEALSDGKLDAAEEHFTKATEIYPDFESAYNYLGVVRMKRGDTAGGKQAFEKAVSINDKYAAAYINLGKIAAQDKNYDEAFNLFTKSLAVEPLNPDALAGICQAGAMAHKYEQVVDASKKLHAMPHDRMHLCHFAAGLAYSNLNDPQNAVAEYTLYMKEAGINDPLVEKAREAIAELDKKAATATH